MQIGPGSAIGVGVLKFGAPEVTFVEKLPNLAVLALRACGVFSQRDSTRDGGAQSPVLDSRRECLAYSLSRADLFRRDGLERNFVGVSANPEPSRMSRENIM